MLTRRLPVVLVPVVLGLLAPIATAAAVGARVPPPAEFEAASSAEQAAVAQVQAARAQRSVVEARVQALNVRVGALGDCCFQRGEDGPHRPIARGERESLREAIHL